MAGSRPTRRCYLYTDAPFHALGEAADAVRRRRYPDGIVTYIIDRNINYTNVCVTACKFCAFYRRAEARRGLVAPDGRDPAPLRRDGRPRRHPGHAAGRPPPGLRRRVLRGAVLRRSRPRTRSWSIHSIGAERDPAHGEGLRRVASRRRSRRIKAAGLDSIAGAGAEMLPARPRTAIAPLKESGERWLEVMETAHGLGVESTATMMMGTGETNAERIEHLRMIRDVQDRTGGFRSFIPWTYQPENNHLKGRTQATSPGVPAADRGRPAVLRQRHHLQGSWLTTGKDVGQLALHMGVDDLGSIMLEENVDLLRRRQAPVQPARADLDDPHRGPHPGAARHALPAPGGALTTRPTTRPTTACVSHFSSTALPGGGAGGRTSLTVVSPRTGSR